MGRQVTVFLALCALAIVPASGAEVVGKVVSQDVRIDGHLVPSGGTILSPALVATGSEPAVLRLSDGSVMTLAANSSAYFEADRIAMRSGSADYQNASGQVAQIDGDMRLFVAQEAQAGAGRKVGEETVRLCQLTNVTRLDECLERPKRSGCNWEPIDAPASEVSDLRTEGARTPAELDLDEDCEDGQGGWWATLAPLAKIGVVGGAAAAGIVLADAIDDDTKSSSRVTP